MFLKAIICLFYGTFLRRSVQFAKILQRQKHRTNFLIPQYCIFLHIHFDEFREFSAFSRFISYIVPNLIHFMCCAALFLYSRNFQKSRGQKAGIFHKKRAVFWAALRKNRICGFGKRDVRFNRADFVSKCVSLCPQKKLSSTDV